MLAGSFLVATPATPAYAGPVGATAVSDGKNVKYKAVPGFANRVVVTTAIGGDDACYVDAGGGTTTGCELPLGFPFP